MKRATLISTLLLGLAGSMPLSSQPTTTLDGFELVNKKSIGGRIYTGAGPEAFSLSPATLAFTRDVSDGKLRVSMNPLFSLAALPAALAFISGNRGWLAFGLFYLPQGLGNLSLQLPVIRRFCYLTVANRTDYYLFNTPAKIYMEGSVGLRLIFGSVGGEVRYVWPITRGFLENKGPYIGVNIYHVTWEKEKLPEPPPPVESAAPN